MLATRLVKLIETHSEPLSEGLLNKFLTSERCSDLRKVDAQELRERSHEIYRNLSDWLMGKTEKEIEERYKEVGMRRAVQGVRFSHFVYAITTTREHLLDFLQREGFSDSTLALYGHLELAHMLDQFFDKALYYAAVGFEQAKRSTAAA